MVNRKIDEQHDGTEGHAAKSGRVEDADTEGHTAKAGRVEDADTEGHAIRIKGG